MDKLRIVFIIGDYKDYNYHTVCIYMEDGRDPYILILTYNIICLFLLNIYFTESFLFLSEPKHWSSVHFLIQDYFHKKWV